MSKCDRCAQNTLSLTMSRFNTEMICPPCEVKEQAHPDYKKAVETELIEVQNGNYNYPGIGKPLDL
jgi:hypothetical protein